jgi:hypothetical protein
MALLACPGYYRQVGSALEEGIRQAAKTQQVIQRANKLRLLWRAGNSFDVCPIGGDQRLTSVRQYGQELQATGHACLPEHFKRLPLEWVVRTGDSHSLRKVLMVGSVWWFPLIRFRMTN